MTRPEADSTLSRHASQTDRSEVFSASGRTGPRSFRDQHRRVPGLPDELAGGCLLFAVQPEVARVGHGGLAPQDVGHGPEDGVVHRMGGDLEGKGGVVEAAALSRLQLLGPLAVLPRLAGQKAGQSLGGLLGAAEVSALVAHAGYGREVKAQLVGRLAGREVGGVRLQGGDAGVLHALHDGDALRRCHDGDVFSQHADVAAVIEMGVGEEDGGHIERRVLAQGQIGGDEVGPVDVELGKKVEVHEVMNAAGVSILEELLVEDAVFAEVLPEIQEDAVAFFFQVDFIPADAVGPIVDCERCRRSPS